MEGEGANKRKFIETAILHRFWQNIYNTEKLLKRLFSFLEIPRFQAVGF